MTAEPRPERVPDSADAAWRAYCAMVESKAAHFAELARQQDKRRDGAGVTLAERALLGELLERHDARVAAFGDAMRRLAGRDPDAQHVLLAVIAEVNRDLGGPEPVN